MVLTGEIQASVPIDFRNGDTVIRVEGTFEYGIATIWVADLLMWAASQIVEARDAGIATSRLMVTTPYEILRIGLQRRDLVDTPVGNYPRTREWAVRLHAETSAHGLLWISRQDDEAKALVLVEDRITKSAFSIEIDREPLYEGKHLDALLTLRVHSADSGTTFARRPGTEL